MGGGDGCLRYGETAVTVGQIAEALETSELDDVSTILERLHEAGKLGRGTGHATGPAVVTYTPRA